MQVEVVKNNQPVYLCTELEITASPPRLLSVQNNYGLLFVQAVGPFGWLLTHTFVSYGHSTSSDAIINNIQKLLAIYPMQV